MQRKKTVQGTQHLKENCRNGSEGELFFFFNVIWFSNSLRKLMIRTSRNVSTFFDTFPCKLRECVLSKLDITTGTCCEEAGSKCACQKKACPLSVPHASDGHSTDTDQGPQDGLRGGGAPVRERAVLATCNTVADAGIPQLGPRGGWTNRLVSFHWLTGPQITLSRVVAVPYWNCGAGPELTRKKGDRGTMRILWAPEPIQDTEGFGKCWLSRVLRIRWDPQEQKQGLDLPCKPCSVTYVTGQDCCCFSNHYSNDYIPSD